MKYTTYKKKSTANINEMSLTGSPTDCKTITIVTRPAEGILAAPIEATVAVKLIKKKFNILKLLDNIL